MTLTTELERIWQDYRAHGADGLPGGQARDDARAGSAPLSSGAALYAALLACAAGSGHRARAHALAAHALAMAPGSVLCQELCRYLGRGEDDASLYAEGEAFAAFIRGGGNQALYRRLAEAMAAHHRRARAARVLDIGVGDGLALLGLLDALSLPAAEAAAGSGLSAGLHIDLIEPSAPMLSRVAAALGERGVAHAAHATDVETFALGERARWDVAQATFSLQCLAPARRGPCLAWLRERCDMLLIAEFDPPSFDEPHGPARAAYLLERYERGIAEYPAGPDAADDRAASGQAGAMSERALVAQGFLMPILVSLFAGNANQNFEQPIDGWVQACRDAGFAQVHAERVCDYWWADAYLVCAR